MPPNVPHKIGINTRSSAEEPIALSPRSCVRMAYGWPSHHIRARPANQRREAQSSLRANSGNWRFQPFIADSWRRARPFRAKSSRSRGPFRPLPAGYRRSVPRGLIICSASPQFPQQRLRAVDRAQGLANTAYINRDIAAKPVVVAEIARQAVAIAVEIETDHGTKPVDHRAA
jgi:hypothetical protein